MLRLTIFIFLFITFSSGNPLSKHGRFSAGKQTTIEQHPWTVSLNMWGKHFCTGAIVNANTIVTAASCCVGLTQIDLVAVAGTTDASQGGTRIHMRGVCVQHESNQGRYPFNIAIIKLQKKLTFNDRIQSVTLPESEALDGGTLTLTGWERESANETVSPNNLRSVQVEVVNRQICAEGYGNTYMVDERMICGNAVEGGSYVRDGDIGGPLMNNDVLYGIAFHGEIGYPYLYTNVAKVTDWIRAKAEL